MKYYMRVHDTAKKERHMGCLNGWGAEWFRRSVVVLGLSGALFANAADQIWNDAGANNSWSTDDLNWDADAAWTNGNSAIFSGGGGAVAGETVDVSNAVEVVGITFQTNGYVIADADANGTLTLVGTPSVPSLLSVVNAGDTGTVSEVLAGTNGFVKTGSGLLQIKGANTYTGVTTVQQGILRLNANTAAALGATGAGNHTVVADGATLDIFSAWSGNRDEDITITGSGVGGIGAFVNLGPTAYYNVGYRNLTLAGDATIGGSQRFDMSGNGTYTGNGHTLTKAGSCEVAISRAVNNSPIVINAGNYTMQHANSLGGSDFPTTVNGGTLNGWPSLTITERIYCNGGALKESAASNTLTVAGHVTLNARTEVTTGSGYSMVNLSGYFDGTGGVLRTGSGYVYVTGNTNTYSGPTVINNGSTLYVGRIGGLTGMLGTGFVTNNGTLYFDRGGAIVCSNGFFGNNTTAIRYGCDMTVDGSFSSNYTWHVAHGSLTLTNGAEFCVYNELTIANRDNVNYGSMDSATTFAIKLTNVVATVNVLDGCELRVKSMTFGNGGDLAGGSMTGILNQVGGIVRTTGSAAEGNGVRLGHYPQVRSFYNMMGGKLIVEGNYDLGCATDGNGWFNMTGGEVFATRVMLNERTGGGGNGRLTVAGGVLNVGTLDASVASVSNGITVDAGGPYLVEYGGAGGVVRAVTNFTSDLNATLYGTNANAITFDTAACAIGLSGNLTGAGGLNKTGTGTLTLSGVNTYTGSTRILQGRVVRSSLAALPAGGEVLFGVTPDDAGGQLYAEGDLSLEGLVVGVANPEALDTSKSYTIATHNGTLTAGFAGSVLPEPWYVHNDWKHNRVLLRAAIGTVFWLR